MEINEQLHAYLKGRYSEMTERWLQQRSGSEGSIYSPSASDDVVLRLREQHRLTMRSMISGLLDGGQDMSRFEDWATLVADDRVQSGTPANEVLRALGWTRAILWETALEFIERRGDDISPRQAAVWCEEINKAFGLMIERFTMYYHEFSQRKFQAQERLVRKLSAPIISIDGELAILPLVGDIDMQRAEGLLERVPLHMSNSRFTVLLIDFSGVAHIGESVSRVLSQLLEALKLMGITCVLSGIRPDVARAATEMGIQFSGTPKTNSFHTFLSDYLASRAKANTHLPPS